MPNSFYEGQQLELTDIQGNAQVITVINNRTITPTHHSQELKSIMSVESESDIASLYIRKITNQSKPFISNDSLRASLKGFANAYVYVWNELHGYGLPVLDDVWKLDDDHIAQTDLSALGYSVYDIKIDSDPQRKPQKADGIFSRIPMKKILTQAERYADLATKHRVRVAHDGAFHVIAKETGEWGLRMLDLGAVHFAVTNPEDLVKLPATNDHLILEWAKTLQVAQKNALRDARHQESLH